MSPLLLIVALVFGMVAAAHYYRALEQVRHVAPQMRDGITLRRGLDFFVWATNMPQAARRSYVLSLACSCVFLASIGFLVYREGARVVAVIFAGIVLVGAALTLARAMRLRAHPR
jgi:hypothetical protein